MLYGEGELVDAQNMIPRDLSSLSVSVIGMRRGAVSANALGMCAGDVWLLFLDVRELWFVNARRKHGKF